MSLCACAKGWTEIAGVGIAAVDNEGGNRRPDITGVDTDGEMRNWWTLQEWTMME